VVETLAGSSLTVIAGRQGEIRSITRALGLSQGASGSVDVSAASVTAATLAGRAVGIDLGNAAQTLVLRGTIDVAFDGIAEAQATANGRAAIAGEGFANTTATASATFAAGVFSPGAKGTIENFGTIEVRAAPTARTASNGRAEGLSGFDPDATAFTNATAVNVEALGIAHAAGTIVNHGRIEAMSAPSVDKARAFSEQAGATSFAIDAISIANAVVDGARAFGIRSYQSDSTIINAAGATISALSVPVSVAEAIAIGAAGTSLGDGDANAVATASARNALAVGIETDKGSHRIENDGTIVAIATPFASATAIAVKAGTGEQSSSQSIDITGAAAFGIRTLGGNNLVINRGTINVSAGHAIQTGGGSDEVRLLGGFTWGRIALGAGADRLVIANAPTILGDIDGGSGTDSIEVTGAATLNGAHSGFESLRKLGAGQFDLGLTAWNPSGTTRIEEGTVRINGGLASSGQQLETLIRPDGTNGALVVRPIGVFLPRGTIVVEKGAGVYVNGTSWDVVQTTDGLNLALLSGGVKLPTATALVSFTSSIFDARRLRVRANVASMAGMVTSPLERSMAQALDDLTPVATGRVASAILGLQQLGDAVEVRAGVAALTPRLPALALTAAQDMTDGAMALVASRTSSLGMVAAPRFGGLSLLASGPVAGQSGAWAASFDGTARSAGAGLGERQGMVSGFDRQAGHDFALGVAVAHQRGIHQLSGAAGSGVLESGLFAAYGRYDGGEGLRAGFALGAGSSGFEGGRLVPGSTLSGRIDGRMQSLAADMSVERDLGRGKFAPALFGRMSWRDTRGLEVAEAGGGGLAVSLEDGRDTRLETGLGIAIAPGLDLGFHRLSTRVSAQWVHQLAGTGPTVTARFADMADHPFLLSGGGRARDALGLDAGLALEFDGGAVLSATVAAVPGDAMREQVARFQLTLPLGRR
jgi:uncharacterized protein with beta-barrel porin domain